MALLIADCPRCGAQKTTFDALASVGIAPYGWRMAFELCAACRHCSLPTLFVVHQAYAGTSDYLASRPIHLLDISLNSVLSVHNYVALGGRRPLPAPEHLAADVASAFDEGVRCVAADCFNAAATMFRLALDLVTRPLLPAEGEPNGPNPKQRRDLGLRLPWLFDHGKLPPDLRDLSHCVREDGNDGAHAGTLSAADAEDLYDFTFALLDRLITEPRRLQLAIERRAARRASQ